MKPLGAPMHSGFWSWPYDRGQARARVKQAAIRAIDEGLESAEDQVYIDHVIAADLAEAAEEGRLP